MTENDLKQALDNVLRRLTINIGLMMIVWVIAVVAVIKFL